MKVIKRSKGIVRFKTEVGSINLEFGTNILNKEQYAALIAHPLFETLKKTSEISFEEEIIVDESKEVDTDLNKIDLTKQSKEFLIELARSLEIEVENMSKKQLIEAIELKKGE